MKKIFILSVLLLTMVMGVFAQRKTDLLDRGLVAIKTNSGVFCSWRILGEEYYDVTYNLYRDGVKIAERLNVSNFTDAAGTSGSKYTVKAVVRGTEQAASKEATPWAQNYREITPGDPGLKSTLVPNDACCADVDGDGELEILMKFDNQSEINNSMQKEGYYGEYSIFKVFKLDGTLLWWVNCGPNMGDFQNNEQNIVAYDWDQDGKAEAVMRLEEGSVIHMADGTTYAIGADGKNGTPWTNYREPRGLGSSKTTVPMAFYLPANATATSANDWITTSIQDGVLYVTCASNPKEGDGVHATGRSGSVTLNNGSTTTRYSVFQLDNNARSVEWFTHYGNEFLVYCEGSTGKPYVVTEFPLKRLEDGETSLEAAWGDGYGHRSSKFFFGAPYLDGRNPSIFLARGIYTRHKMIAYDVNPDTHELTVRWRWNCNNAGSPWYGQGYHNFAVVDVDWDGRDEICFGSMVIDDNGHGLSTTGLGHGDAQHHGDFNPYIHGQEIFACNEDHPGNNYRDATTSKIYYRYVAGDDDGRSMMGNFTNDYPGCQGVSSRDPNLIGSVINNPLAGGTKNNITQNFRIYWDGDLCEETQDYYDGKNTAIAIYKYGEGEIDRLTGSMTNNDTKGTPCYQGDVLGDWREEIIARTKDNKIRIYSTTIPTEWRNYTLWHDMQYRNAMVWQMCGYNQPPHTSYFLGELEGITQAPPALTTTGRIEVKNGGTINNVDTPNPHWLLAETSDATVTVQDGCSPYIVTVNTPSWVQGHDNNDNITTEYFTHKLTVGAFAGSMRLVKQGDGILELPDVVEKYTGNTDVWAGTLRFNGTLESSPLWLNRHTTLESDGGVFKAGIKADYNATLSSGTASKAGVITATDLKLGFGSRVVFDVFSEGQQADCIKATSLTIEKKDWQNGPQYAAPVFQFVTHAASGSSKLAEGNYLIGEIGSIEGSLGDLVTEGLDGLDAKLSYSDGKLYLSVGSLREPTTLTWSGNEDNVWDMNKTKNFKNTSSDASEFVSGDAIVFDDNASSTNVQIAEDIYPSSVVFKNNSKDYTIIGSAISGSVILTIDGAGNVTINNVNKYTGATMLNNGKLTVSSLANTDGVEYGALGGVNNTITLNGGTLANTQSIVTTQPISITEKGILEVKAGTNLTMNGAIGGTGKELVKTGNGTLVLNGKASYGKLTINQGTVQGGEINEKQHQYPATIVLNGGVLKDPDNINSYSANTANIEVPEGKTATWTLDSRCDYTGKLTGKGTLTVNVTSVRSNMKGDWSQFEGTLIFKNTKTGSYPPSLQWNNDKGLGKATVTGTFNNEGKNVAIGTIQGDATLTGSGSYTAKNLSLKVTRGRGNNTNTKISVAGTLTVIGCINVTWTGTQPKLGEEVTLWTVNKLIASSSLELNLPTLPAGLYWDTTDLLKPTGILRVTDTPTGITDVHMDRRDNGYYYTLDGVRIENPTKKGIYIKNGKKVLIK